jgi:hypothetical protein
MQKTEAFAGRWICKVVGDWGAGLRGRLAVGSGTGGVAALEIRGWSRDAGVFDTVLMYANLS